MQLEHAENNMELSDAPTQPDNLLNGKTENNITDSNHNHQTIIRLTSTNHFKNYSDPFKVQEELINNLGENIVKDIEKVFINRHNNQLYIIISNLHTNSIKLIQDFKWKKEAFENGNLEKSVPKKTIFLSLKILKNKIF